MNTNRILVAATMAVLLSGAAAASDDLDDLFDLDAPLDAAGEGGAPVAASGTGLRLSGYGDFSAAYTTANPSHWSKLRARFELAGTGRLANGMGYKVSARADGDAAYHPGRDFYPEPVKDDQRTSFMLRENYLDIESGDWAFRLGRQHIVWGEVVGLFFADVVSARDTREFFLPEFETLRIPQWAARAEYFAGETHVEVVWIPYPSYDEIGKPGADFYPFPVPGDVRVRTNEPTRNLSNTNWGVRVSHLVSGWDLTGFYYQSRDVAPTLYRLPTGLELRHERIEQLGGTFSKDMGSFVLKGEAVYTDGRKFLSTDPAARFGLKASDIVDYVVGADIPTGDWRLNLQLFGRHTFDHDRSLGFDRDELGYTVLVNHRFSDRFEAEVLYASSFNRSDYMVQPKLVWNITQEWRARFGADLFGGRSEGLFGRFDDSDRVYAELRRWF
ncbi:DUF1302 family protein [Rhodocyclaceae bacterium SMB388]